jgi:hypothetical protein
VAQVESLTAMPAVLARFASSTLTTLCLVGLLAVRADAAFDQSHELYGSVLNRFVRDGLVDYRGLHADPKDLERYLKELAVVVRSEFDHWPRAEQIAFLINLYNAQTLKLIVDHYPVKSIKDIGGFLRGPWSQPVVNVFGETVTLDDIEHGVLRKRYAEPRIHFALVCAAMGCPPLRAEAYVGSRLDAQLDDQARIFLSTSSKNRVDPKARILYLSPIFKWFAADFISKSGSLEVFVRPFLPAHASEALAEGNHEIRYTDYDWSLNDASTARTNGRR